MITDIFQEIQKAGLTISILNGSSLVVKPKDRITDYLRVRIKIHKQELIRYLSVTPEACKNCKRPASFAWGKN